MSSTQADPDRVAERTDRPASGEEGVVKGKTGRGQAAKTALLAVVLVWCLAPFVWLILTSLKESTQALDHPSPFVGPFGFSNYEAVFGQNFGYTLRNSLIVAGTTTVLVIAIGSLAAYALARLPLKRKLVVLSGVLAISLFPPVSLVPPLYEVWRSLGLLNTYPSMWISYTAFTLPLTIFVLTTFFSQIPPDLEEAARVDGASPFQAFYRVIVPLAAPGVGATAILAFVFAWNEFLLASTFCPRTLSCQTVPVAIASFTGASQFERPIGDITAASVLVVIPMIIVVLVFQRRIVSGLTAGGVKG